MRRIVIVTLIAMFALVSGASWTGMAQTATGQITGAVKDANGAAMACSTETTINPSNGNI